MITAQLGPPPAVPGRASTAETTTGDDALGTSTATEDGTFVALLLGNGPSADGAADTAQPPPAAGPLTGELPTATDADAAGHAPPPAAATGLPASGTTIAAAPQGPTTAMPGTAVAAVAAPGDSVTGAHSATAVPSGGSTRSASPAAGVVGSPGSAGPAPAGAPVQGGAPSAPIAVGAPAAPPDQAPAATATVTITLSRQDVPAAAVPGATPAVPASAPAPAAPTAAPTAAPASTVETPAAPVPPPAQTTAPALPPAAGNAGMPSGVTSAAELAHELGARMRMAVREGGRELVVNLRPPELGHLTVRVTMIDGALTAHITADRPDAARLLQQSLPQLGAVLGDLGYNLDGLDVAYGGQDRRDAPGSSPGGDTAHAGTPDGESATIPLPSTAATVTDGDRLDLLV